MSLYKLLVIVHVFSAILGLGPGFILTFLVNRAETMSEVRHGFILRRRIHTFVVIGGMLLLITGLSMGFLNTALWSQWWYVISLVLYLITLAAGPLVLVNFIKPIKKMLVDYKGEKIPKDYEYYANKLFFSEHILNLIFIVIIFLMITKPF